MRVVLISGASCPWSPESVFGPGLSHYHGRCHPHWHQRLGCRDAERRHRRRRQSGLQAPGGRGQCRGLLLARLRFFFEKGLEPLVRIKPGFPSCEPIACSFSRDKKNEHEVFAPRARRRRKPENPVVKKIYYQRSLEEAEVRFACSWVGEEEESNLINLKR